MHAVDWLGISGSLLVFGSFWMKSTVPLRVLALASNVLFIAYGYAAWLIPILVLHCALLPLNLARLWQLHRQASGNAANRAGKPQGWERAGIFPAAASDPKVLHRPEGSASEAF